MSAPEPPASQPVTRLKRLGDLLFGASAALQTPGERKRARLSAALLFFVTLLTLADPLSALLIRGRLSTGNLYSLLLAALLALAYLLSRTRYFAAGASLALVVLSLIGYAFAVSDGTGLTLLSLIFTALILSSVLLNSLGTVILLGLNCLAILLLAPRIYPPEGEVNAGTLLGFVLAIGACAVIVSIFRDQLERDRLADVTAANAELRQLQLSLEKRVEERTRELEAKNHELESFAYSVSHDLKAPLRGIDGYSQLLAQDYAGRLDQEGLEFLRNIQRAVNSMHHLIDDLLAYSRMQRREWTASPVQLAGLVGKVVDEMLLACEGDQPVIRTEIPDATIYVDSDGLAQALRNLLSNAIKFSCKSAQPYIEIAGQEDAETITLSVKDNGIGFDMKYHDRIFGIFQRLERPEEYPGTGIGLALVRGSMERMGGQVWAESAPGQGATFYLRIPRQIPQKS